MESERKTLTWIKGARAPGTKGTPGPPPPSTTPPRGGDLTEWSEESCPRRIRQCGAVDFVILVISLGREGFLSSTSEVWPELVPGRLGGGQDPGNARAAHPFLFMVITSYPFVPESTPSQWVLAMASDNVSQIADSDLEEVRSNQYHWFKWDCLVLLAGGLGLCPSLGVACLNFVFEMFVCELQDLFVCVAPVHVGVLHS